MISDNSHEQEPRARLLQVSLPPIISLSTRMEREIQRTSFSIRAELLHRGRLSGVVGNLISNFFQHAGDVVGQVIGEVFVHHQRPAAEVDHCGRVVDAFDPAVI